MKTWFQCSLLQLWALKLTFVLFVTLIFQKAGLAALILLPDTLGKKYETQRSL